MSPSSATPANELQSAESQASSWLHQRREETPMDRSYSGPLLKPSYAVRAIKSVEWFADKLLEIRNISGASRVDSYNSPEPSRSIERISRRDHAGSIHGVRRSPIPSPPIYKAADSPFPSHQATPSVATTIHSVGRSSIASPRSYRTANSTLASYRNALSIATTLNSEGRSSVVSPRSYETARSFFASNPTTHSITTNKSRKAPYYRSTPGSSEMERVAVNEVALLIISKIPGSDLPPPAFLRHLEHHLNKKILHSPLYINGDTEDEAQRALADDMHAYIVAYLGAACDLEIGEELRHEIRSHLSTLATKQNERRRVEQGVANSSLEDFKVFGSAWLEHLESKGILLAPDDELNWSGRGQHVEYKPAEERKIPLKPERFLGHSASAIVESVLCRRIRLARKKIQCSRRLSKEDAIDEVRHLQHIQHSHVVRVVGTYTIMRYLAILLYPVAQWNLEEFMDDADLIPIVHRQRDLALSTFFSCLTHTISFLHANYVKHMDIKPKNILIRQTASSNSHRSCYKVYLADFGIARAYQSTVEAETDSPTLYTRTYAAPEVVRQEFRGFSADIFSLGCVFIEMAAAILSLDKDLQTIRCNAHGDTSYHANIEAVCDWYGGVPRQLLDSCDPDGRLQLPSGLFLDALSRMLDEQADLRPSARRLASYVGSDGGCFSCFSGPEPFEAAQSISD